ncbi:MAG: hypothetical protein KKG47_05505 [Proteobacteria bacterium]|nr:hypothetical protein [Pseudomonadota bacterium]MBU1736932.1 hypothetical protein [Pseudomonadota bacterium]
MKQHLMIIIAIVVGFSTFMLGYSLPPFLEVGFGDGAGIEGGVAPDSELLKQYENLYKSEEE